MRVQMKGDAFAQSTHEGPVIRFYIHEVDFFAHDTGEPGAFLVKIATKALGKIRVERCE